MPRHFRHSVRLFRQLVLVALQWMVATDNMKIFFSTSFILLALVVTAGVAPTVHAQFGSLDTTEGQNAPSAEEQASVNMPGISTSDPSAEKTPKPYEGTKEDEAYSW